MSSLRVRFRERVEALDTAPSRKQPSRPSLTPGNVQKLHSTDYSCTAAELVVVTMVTISSVYIQCFRRCRDRDAPPPADCSLLQCGLCPFLADQLCPGSADKGAQSTSYTSA